jgi:hypothetical protein
MTSVVCGLGHTCIIVNSEDEKFDQLPIALHKVEVAPSDNDNKKRKNSSDANNEKRVKA